MQRIHALLLWTRFVASPPNKVNHQRIRIWISTIWITIWTIWRILLFWPGGLIKFTKRLWNSSPLYELTPNAIQLPHTIQPLSLRSTEPSKCASDSNFRLFTKCPQCFASLQNLCNALHTKTQRMPQKKRGGPRYSGRKTDRKSVMLVQQKKELRKRWRLL